MFKPNSLILNINPLAANVYYINDLVGVACRRRSAFHRQNHDKRSRIFRKRIEFVTKWYTKLCKQLESIASNRISNLEFIPAKKGIFERGLPVKGLNNKYDLVIRLFIVIFKGVHSDIKCEAWKYLLGYYQFHATYEERCNRIIKLKLVEYHSPV